MDILESQAIIKSRRQIIRDTSGRYTRADEAIRVRLVAGRMRERLEVDVPAMEHAAGYVVIPRHRRRVAGTARRHAIETVAPVDETVDPMPLFHQRAA